MPRRKLRTAVIIPPASDTKLTNLQSVQDTFENLVQDSMKSYSNLCVRSNPLNEHGLQQLHNQLRYNKGAVLSLINSMSKEVLNETKVYDLEHKLKSAIQMLTTLNQERVHLVEKISERYLKIYPNVEDITLLEKSYQKVFATLKLKLENFLLTFSLINFNNMHNSHAKYFTEKLTSFVVELMADLEKDDGLVNKTELSELHAKLLGHLGKESSFFDNLWVSFSKFSSRNLDDSKLMTDEIEQIILNLFRKEELDGINFLEQYANILTLGWFDSSINDIEITVKQQQLTYKIVQLNIIIDKLDTFNINAIYDYQICMDIVCNQDITIGDECKEIESDIDDLLTKLELSLLLLPIDSGKKNQQAIEQLIQCKDELQISKYFLKENSLKYEEAIRPFLNSKLSLESWQKTTEIKQNYIMLLNKEKVKIKDFQFKCEASIEVVNKLYEKEKEELKKELSIAMSYVREALLVLEDQTSKVSESFMFVDTAISLLVNDRFSLNNKEIEDEKNKIQEKAANSLSHAKHSLNRLFKERGSLPSHQQDVNETKHKLSRSLLDIINTLKNLMQPEKYLLDNSPRLFSSKISRLDNNNPFKNDENLDKIQKDAIKAVDSVNIIFNQLDTMTVALKDWQTFFNQNLEEANNQVINRNALYKKAEELEGRLKNPNYHASLSVLVNIAEEYNRIKEKCDHKVKSISSDNKSNLPFLDDPIFTWPSHRTLQSPPLTHVRDGDDETANKIALLDSIDLRLVKLARMYARFSQLNKDYINKDINKLNDASYKQTLMDIALNCLSYDHMEDISDGKRSCFIQWLRIHVFKPLQMAAQKGLNHLTPKSSDESNSDVKFSRFFPTILACKTERTLIDKGNELMEVLLRSGP